MSDKTGSRRMTRDQAAGLREVLGGLPAALVELLPQKTPLVMRDSVLDALRDRTAAQLCERVARRWIEHGYAEALESPDGRGLTSPVGVVVALVRVGVDCPDASCEDGVIIGSGSPCRACTVRRQDRRAAARSGESLPRQAGSSVQRWLCAGRGGSCRAVAYGAAPADGLCGDCRAEAAEEREARRGLGDLLGSEALA